MAWYTTFTTPDGEKCAYIYRTKKQLVSADKFLKKTFSSVYHVTTGKETQKQAQKRLLSDGIKAIFAVENHDCYTSGDFLLPFPGKEFFQKPIYYY